MRAIFITIAAVLSAAIATSAMAAEGPECVRNVVRAKVGFSHPQNAYERQLNQWGALFDQSFPNVNIISLASTQCNVDPAIARTIIADEMDAITARGIH